MLPVVFRPALLSLALALIPALGGSAFAQPAPAAEDLRMLPYAQPGQRVDIGGRRINLKCFGTGAPTVVLMAGLSSWSPVWYKTQPEIAKKTQVCAFDRASYGFSDPAPRPQILSDVPEDLHAALKAANLPGPYVLVGHSLGGLEARLFAQRWPQETAGLVLVDSSVGAESLIEAGLPGYDESQQPEKYASKMLRCALLAAPGPLEPSSPDYAECTQALPGETPAAFRQAWPRFFTAAYAAAKLSLLSSTFTHRYDSADSLRLGDKPLVVLTADDTGLVGAAAINFFRGYAGRRRAQHEALAHMSSRGAYRLVGNSGHQIELDQPQAVIDAVDEVLGKLSARTPDKR